MNNLIIELGSASVSGFLFTSNKEILKKERVISIGLKKGDIQSIEVLASDISQLIQKITLSSGITEYEVIILLPTQVIEVQNLSTYVNLPNKEVRQNDIDRAKSLLECNSTTSKDYECIEIIPTSFIVDKVTVHDPINISGSSLQIKGSHISVNSQYLKNLKKTLNLANIADFKTQYKHSFYKRIEPEDSGTKNAYIFLNEDSVEFYITNNNGFIQVSSFYLGTDSIFNDLMFAFDLSPLQAKEIFNTMLDDSTEYNIVSYRVNELISLALTDVDINSFNKVFLHTEIDKENKKEVILNQVKLLLNTSVLFRFKSVINIESKPDVFLYTGSKKRANKSMEIQKKPIKNDINSVKDIAIIERKEFSIRLPEKEMKSDNWIDKIINYLNSIF